MITVREALSHRAGLAALDTDLLEDVLAWDPVIRALEGNDRCMPRSGAICITR